MSTTDAGASGLTLSALHQANIARQAEWCPKQVPDLSFRGNELAGETGEACNVIKKLERERQGWRGSRATKEALAEELADVVICADLCAVTAGINLDAAVTAKFNATSEKQGLSVFLPLAAPIPPKPEDGLAAQPLQCTQEIVNAYREQSAMGRSIERGLDAVLALIPTPQAGAATEHAGDTASSEYWRASQARWLHRRDGECDDDWIARLRRHFCSLNTITSRTTPSNPPAADRREAVARIICKKVAEHALEPEHSISDYVEKYWTQCKHEADAILALQPATNREGLSGAARPDWLARSAWIAERLQPAIIRRMDALKIVVRNDRSENGKGLWHALFLCNALTDPTKYPAAGIDSDTKACRWLGYLQAMLVYENVCTLDEMKKINLASGSASQSDRASAQTGTTEEQK